jgi:hypothetical protein
MRLFFLTIPKPLKQYTLFKKEYPFRSYKCVHEGVLPRVTILAEWLRHFNGLEVGETAAPACFSRENAEGAGLPPLLSL